MARRNSPAGTGLDTPSDDRPSGAKLPAWPKNKGVSQYRSPDGDHDTSMGAVVDVSAKIERDAKNYRR
jgi:hypothetical protein